MKNCNNLKNLNECDIHLDSNTPRLNIDYELYQNYLDNFDHSTDEKNKFLDVVWTIIVNFVDLGFEIHPLQQVHEEKKSLDEFLDSSANHMLQKQIQSFIKTKNESNSENHIKHERNLQ